MPIQGFLSAFYPVVYLSYGVASGEEDIHGITFSLPGAF